MVKKMIKGIAVLGILLCSITACSTGGGENEAPKTVGQIAYDKEPKYGYTVYIMENDKLTPYLVLTNEYQGNTLLLRKDILAVGTYSDEADNYYATSNIDDYLQSEYIPILTNDFIDRLCLTDIGISCEFPNEAKTETISRKAFLLSASEADFDSDLLFAKDGEPLSYFSDKNNYIAEYNGNACAWYLRSAYLEDRSLICGISDVGQSGGGSVSYSSGIRPAICISGNTPISVIDEDDSAKYIIE